MAGATSSGALDATTVVVKGSSAIPMASLAMVWTVAGATTMTSACRASSTCSTAYSESASKASVTTGRWVRLRKASGVTNCVAPRLIMVSTNAPACVSLLARSRAL